MPIYAIMAHWSKTELESDSIDRSCFIVNWAVGESEGGASTPGRTDNTRLCPHIFPVFEMPRESGDTYEVSHLL